MHHVNMDRYTKTMTFKVQNREKMECKPFYKHQTEGSKNPIE